MEDCGRVVGGEEKVFGVVEVDVVWEFVGGDLCEVRRGVVLRGIEGWNDVGRVDVVYVFDDCDVVFGGGVVGVF